MIFPSRELIGIYLVGEGSKPAVAPPGSICAAMAGFQPPIGEALVRRFGG
jgi:hypothetical protein